MVIVKVYIAITILFIEDECMKKIIISLQIIIMCICIFGCSDNKDKNIVYNNKYIKEIPSCLDEGEFVICMNNMDLEINPNTMMAEIPFHIISTEKLSLEDIEINIDTSVPYEIAFLESTYNTGKFSEYICLSYNGFDWKYFKELESSYDELKIEEFKQMKEDISKEYEALSEKDFPTFYDNSYVIRFDTFEQEYERHEINTLEIFVKGSKSTIDIGKVYMGIPAKQINVGDYQLYFLTAGRAYYNIVQDATGIISLKSFEMQVKEDVVIKDIYLLNESSSIKIENVTFDIISDDGTFNLEWTEGKDISLEKGAQVFLNCDVHDEKFEGKQAYSVNIYINVEYEVAGERYETRTQVLCGSRYDSQILYALYVDGQNMSVYFEEYYN